MDKNLCSEVASDMSGFPPIKRRAVTMLRCIIKQMVVKNQEAKDALESYIKDFNIANFPGENVPSACLPVKPFAKALGNDALPSNVIRKVLDCLLNRPRRLSMRYAQAKSRCGVQHSTKMH